MTRIDRLARSTFDLFAIVKRIVNAGGQFRSPAEPLADTSTSTGRLLIAVLGGLAERDPPLPIYGAPTPGRDRPPPKTEKNGGPWTDGLIQNCDRLPIWIEPDCLIRRIIDHKPNRFAKRGDPFWKAIEHLPHETHRTLSSVKIDAEEFLDTDHRGHENRAWHGLLC